MRFCFTAPALLVGLCGLVSGQDPSPTRAGEPSASAVEKVLSELVKNDRRVEQRLAELAAERKAVEKVLQALVATDAATARQLRETNEKISGIDKEMKSLKEVAEAINATNQKVRDLAVQMAEVREEGRQNRINAKAVDERLAKIEKQVASSATTAAEQKGKVDALIPPTVADKVLLLKAELKELNAELGRQRGANKSASAKTVDEHAVDKWLAAQESLAAMKEQYGDGKLKPRPPGEPNAQYTARYEQWVKMGKDIEAAQKTFYALDSKSNEGNQVAVFAPVREALKKRESVVQELRELTGAK